MIMAKFMMGFVIILGAVDEQSALPLGGILGLGAVGLGFMWWAANDLARESRRNAL